MQLTPEQTARLVELEEICESGISGQMISVYLPNLSDDGIWKLARWGEKLSDTSPRLAEWLHSIAVEEIYRRGATSPVEAKTPRLPVDWNDSELADALEAAFSIAAANGLKELDSFFGEVSLNIAVQSAQRLRRAK